VLLPGSSAPPHVSDAPSEAPGETTPQDAPSEPAAGVRVVAPVPYAPTLRERVRSFTKKHGRKLWWIHSTYALGLGITVVTVAQKGFDHARWLAVSVVAAWLLVVVFFRVHGSGREQAHIAGSTAKVKLGFFAMTYALKNLYQGMLFFLLPFYWKSTTFGSLNTWFVLLLGACALLSTFDIVFDRVVIRFRALASVFHAVALFGCLNLVVPALFPNTRTLVSLLTAAGVSTIAFWSIHVRASTLRDRRWLATAIASVGLSLGIVYAARGAIPPVPMYLAHGAVGPIVLPDGRLGMEVSELHPSVIDKLIAITDVVVPGGKGDRLYHAWRHDGREVQRSLEGTSRVDGPKGTVRLRSALTGRELPPNLVGSWCVDVETEDGQLVGRVAFTVAD
jgi:hypothetical protein